MSELFKNRIAEVRKKSGLTLQQVADAIGVSNGTISRYETGSREPKLATWEKLADLFNVSISYLQGIITYEDEQRNRLLNRVRMVLITSVLREVFSTSGDEEEYQGERFNVGKYVILLYTAAGILFRNLPKTLVQKYKKQLNEGKSLNFANFSNDEYGEISTRSINFLEMIDEVADEHGNDHPVEIAIKSLNVKSSDQEIAFSLYNALKQQSGDTYPDDKEDFFLIHIKNLINVSSERFIHDYRKAFSRTTNPNNKEIKFANSPEKQREIIDNATNEYISLLRNIQSEITKRYIEHGQK